MRYIKLYESFKTSIEDIKDILLEIEDIGYETNIFNTYLIIKKHYEGFNFYNDKNKINFNEIKDCVLRLKDYLGDRYISCSIFVSTQDSLTSWKQINLGEDTNIDSLEFRKLLITFYEFY